MALLDTFFVYEGIRKAFFLGLRVKPILKALDLQPGERLLDAGCGYGYFARYCEDADYTGIDFDPGRIELARRRRAAYPHQKFQVGDATCLGFPDKSFDKVICYGLLHHLSDEAASLCLRELNRVSRGKIVFSDVMYDRWHLINNLLSSLDSGKFVRRPTDYEALVRRHLNLAESRFFYARNGLAKYFLMTALPKT